MKRYQSYSSAETKKIAAKIAKATSAPRQRSGLQGALVIALSGELGAGKTTFVKGFVRALGSRARVMSPTFILMRRHTLKSPYSPSLPARLNDISHSGRSRGFANLFHLDAYRLKSEKDLAVLGFKEILADPKNIILIEWPERVKKAIPKKHMRIAFMHGKKENERVIEIEK